MFREVGNFICEDEEVISYVGEVNKDFQLQCNLQVVKVGVLGMQLLGSEFC